MPGMTKAGYIPPAQEQPPKQHKKPKGKPVKKKKRRMSPAAKASLIVFMLAFVIAAGTLHIFARVEKAADVFAPGQMLSGHPLGGLTAEEGMALLDKLTQERVESWRFDIACQGRTYTLTAQDIGLFIDRQATLEPLWQVGKTGSMIERYMALFKAQAQRNNVVPVFGYTMEAVDTLLAQIKMETERAAADAQVSFSPGSSTPFRFTDEVVGYTFETDALRAKIEEAILGMTPESAEVKPKEIQPAVTRAALEAAISLRSRVRMTLDDDPASIENVRIAAGVLSGRRIEPGERFSFNEAVGRRTAEGGYQQAAEPAYGVGAVGIGGGVCQVSSALYSAALLGEVEVEERSAAVRPVDYCEMGQEAAVSDQGIDLVLRNQGSMPLFLLTRIYAAENGAQVLEVQLIGEPLEARYALVSYPLEMGMITEPVYMQDKTGKFAVYTDERIPGGEAQPGYSVKVERVTLGENGEQLGSEVISEDVYAAIAPVIYVGMQERN